MRYLKDHLNIIKIECALDHTTEIKTSLAPSIYTYLNLSI